MRQLQPQRPQYDASQDMASDEASALQSAAIGNANAAGGLHVIAGAVGGQVHDFILKLKNSGFCGFDLETFLSTYLIYEH